MRTVIINGAMTIGFEKDGLRLQLAKSEDDVLAAQSLRYDVFVRELGGSGAEGIDHVSGQEADRFDDFADHLILRDLETGVVVGAYRVLRGDQARRAGGYYCEGEYDLTPLTASGRRLLELGRSCVRPDYRGGVAMFHLWTGLARYVMLHGSEILFGVASLKGTEPDSLSGPLSLLHHRYLAPPDLRVRSRVHQRMDLIPEAQLDRKAAMVSMPALIKSYLRLGGMVGDGAFVDHDFNCTDVCMIMDTGALNERAVRLYQPAAE